MEITFRLVIRRRIVGGMDTNVDLMGPTQLACGVTTPRRLVLVQMLTVKKYLVVSFALTAVGVVTTVVVGVGVRLHPLPRVVCRAYRVHPH